MIQCGEKYFKSRFSVLSEKQCSQNRRCSTSSDSTSHSVDSLVVSEEEKRPITRKNFMKVLKNGRLGKRRRRSRKSKPLIKTRTMFIFSPENRWDGLTMVKILFLFSPWTHKTGVVWEGPILITSQRPRNGDDDYDGSYNSHRCNHNRGNIDNRPRKIICPLKPERDRCQADKSTIHRVKRKLWNRKQ